MQAHAHDLREEVGKILDDAAKADSLVHAVAGDWRSAPLAAADRALCDFAAKLTHKPQAISSADLDVLREHGFDDRAIHDATQVIASFNYFTRIAEGLGVEPEDFIQPWGHTTEEINS